MVTEAHDHTDEALVPLGAVLDRAADLADEAVDAAARAVLQLRGPPCDLDAERAVLGGILLDQLSLGDAVAAGLGGEHFYRPAHGVIFRTFTGLAEAKEPIDCITVVGKLQEAGQLDAVGGAAAVSQLEAMLPTSAHVGAYARRLVDLASRRQVLDTAQEMARAAIGGRERPAEIIRFAEHQLARAKQTAKLKSRFASEMQRAHDDLARAGVKKRSWERPAGKSALALAESQVQPPPWVVQGMMREQGVVVLGGAPKGGKTWDEAELAIAVASGTPAFAEFRVETPGAVMMYCLEDDERDLRTRHRALATGRRMPLRVALGRVFYEARGALDLFSDEDCAGVVASARMLPEKPVLVCIDPLRDANSGEENSNDDIRKLMHRVRAIRDVLGCAVMLVHHLSKPGTEARGAPTGSIFDRFRGAGALRGAWDACIGKDTRVRTPSCIKSRMEVETRGGRGAGVFGLQLDISDDDHGNAVSAGYAFFRDPKELFEDGAPAKPKTQAERIDAAKDRLLKTLQFELRRDERAAREPRPWSAKYLGEQCKITEPTARRYLAELAAARHVIGTPRGWRALTTGEAEDSDT